MDLLALILKVQRGSLTSWTRDHHDEGCIGPSIVSLAALLILSVAFAESN